jgi:hypothetical protein
MFQRVSLGKARAQRVARIRSAVVLVVRFDVAMALAERATISVVIARLDRAIQYAAASRRSSNVSGIVGASAKPGDDGGVAV